MTNPYPLGAFLGTPAPNLLAPFTAMMGQPLYFNVFTDFTAPPSEWPGNAGWGAGDAAGSAGYAPSTGMIPLVHFPTFSTSSSAPSTAAILAGFTANAAGVSPYDNITEGMVQAYADAGYKNVYWRVGVEMNLSDGTYTYEGLQPQWIAAFQSISKKLKSFSAQIGIGCKVIWNPGVASGQMSGDIRTTMWSGTASEMGADLIGGDVYDGVLNWMPNTAALEASVAGLDWRTAPYPTPLESFYDTLEDSTGTAFTVPAMIAFAKVQGVPICTPETGAGQAPADNPWFVRWLRHKLDGAVEQGVPVAFVSIWDSNADASDCFTTGSKPQEAAAWVYFFGPAAAAAPVVTPTPAPAPVHAASAANTQITGTTGSIYDTNGTEWTINASGQIEMNGVVVPSSANVVTLFWSGTALDQLNKSGTWWTQPLTGVAGTELATAPTGYEPPAPTPAPTPTPTPTPPPTRGPSAAGTQVPPPAITTIYDTAGNAWTINANKQIELNGAVVASSANVVTLFWDGKALSQLNTSGAWWTQPLTGAAGTELTAAPAGYVA
jgi:hypothetical protein